MAVDSLFSKTKAPYSVALTSRFSAMEDDELFHWCVEQFGEDNFSIWPFRIYFATEEMVTLFKIGQSRYCE